MRKSRGMSLLEVSLAVSVGLMLTVGGAYAYRQHMQAARITQAQLMLETMRMGINRYQVRTGGFPILAVLQGNNDGLGRGFYGPPVPSSLRDPLYPPILETQPSPIKNLATTPNAVAPWGGWRYNAANGELRPNFNPADYPGHDPNKW